MSKTTDKVINLMEKEQATPNNKCLPKENIYKSLAAFQQECQVIHKGTKGYGYSYADLPTILSVINPLRTILFHVSSGDTIESCVAIPQGVQLKGMNEFQVYGSAITYFRRYAISSLLGIVTDKDTDAGGEQIKPTLDESTFLKALDAIQNNKYTKKQLQDKYSLSSKQTKTLELC